MGRKARPWAECHPDRKHIAKGLCRNCYYLQREHRLKSTPEGRAKVSDFYRRHRLKKFGINAEQYEVLFASNGGRCYICHGVQEGKRLAVDHCHETGVVRGLLCETCNRGIGMLKDSPALLRAAAAYLERHKLSLTA